AHLMALQSAKLVVLPDLSGIISSVNNNILINCFCQIAKKENIHLIATGVTDSNKGIYKTAYLFYPDGNFKYYYQVHLEESESKVFTPGNRLVVWETEIGRIGIMLGYEGFLPEVPRCLTLMGADIIAWPINFTSHYYQLVSRTRASENRIYTLVVNTCGSNGSMVINPFGTIQVASFQDHEQAIGTQIEISLARNKNIVPGSNVIKDRIPSAYKELCI
ncbi:MAG: carbon-nitrogen hydrolase family protein, partial [Peptococcales bacterium]